MKKRPAKLCDETLRQMGIVFENADEDWKTSAHEMVIEIASRQPFLLSLDILQSLEKRYPDLATPDLRAIGPIMARAARDGTIEHVELVRRNDKHQRGSTVRWRSLIYRANVGRSA